MDIALRRLVDVALQKQTYTARCRRSGGWWAITVPEVKGIHTQAKRLAQIEATVRDAIALMLDVPQDSFEVRWTLTKEGDRKMSDDVDPVRPRTYSPVIVDGSRAGHRLTRWERFVRWCGWGWIDPWGRDRTPVRSVDVATKPRSEINPSHRRVELDSAHGMWHVLGWLTVAIPLGVVYALVVQLMGWTQVWAGLGTLGVIALVGIGWSIWLTRHLR